EGAAIPAILEVNAPLISEQREHRSLHDETAAIAATTRQLRSAAVVSCVSEAVATWAREQGADPATVAVTPNGVNTDRITPGTGSAGRGTVTVGFVGTLKPWHGTDLLLHSLARTRHPMRLDICGTGPQREALAELAADLGITHRVRLRGALAPE